VDTATKRAKTILEERLATVEKEGTRIRAALTALREPSHKRTPRPKTGGGSRKRSSRGRSGSSRADQFIKLVERNPGITIPKIAKDMHIDPNYLYRVAGDLTDKGRVTKRDGGYHPSTVVPDKGKKVAA
jgi:hypothetical protein